MSRQVRLDDDVAAALDALALRMGGSLTEQANRKLRQVLGITLPVSPPSTRVAKPATALLSTAHAVATSSCKHRPAARLAGVCMDCGRKP